MRQIRQCLRLHLEAGLTYSQVALATGVSKATVGKFVLLARVSGVDWAVAQTLTDEQIEARLFRPPVPRASYQLTPDFALIHQELKRPGVTLQLLWEEYQQGCEQAYRYTSFCIKYRAWAATLKRSMRQVHIAGERLFVDFAGQTVPLIDATTGEITRAQIFVAVLGASNYTYACATATQTAIDWVGSIINALEFVGGVPVLIVPDQASGLVARPDRYEPKLNRLVEEFSEHYGVTVLPARPAHPKDKPKVEVAVQIVERWILARLRNRQFFSLHELNTAIVLLLADLNARAFKKLPGCRQTAFEALDQPVLKPLPLARMTMAQFKRARVNIDYHVELDGHYYSVPHRLVGAEVELRVTTTMVEILAKRTRVAIHRYNPKRGWHTTIGAHMPASHRAHRDWTPGKLISWGERIGVACATLVRWQMANRRHPEQGYRSCLGLLRLSRDYTPERLEAACARAISIKSHTYKSVLSILKAGFDKQAATQPAPTGPMPIHENVRGPDYYH
jgi:transposase